MGKKPPVSPSKDQMISTAAHLLQKQGYQATGVAEVIKKSGAPRGSFYHHFPNGKNELAIEAILWNRHHVLAYLGQKMAQAVSGSEAIEILAQEAINKLHSTQFELGCPFAIVGLESVSLSDEIREACSGSLHAIQDLIEFHLRRDLSAEKACELAPLIYSIFQGAFIVSQTAKNTKTLEVFLDKIPALLTL
jgi:TetR/AcrR family transcriptional regulator, lmrAB and yxaGH operons repressor